MYALPKRGTELAFSCNMIFLKYLLLKHVVEGEYKFLVYYQINGAATQGPQELNHNHI